MGGRSLLGHRGDFTGTKNVAFKYPGPEQAGEPDLGVLSNVFGTLRDNFIGLQIPSLDLGRILPCACLALPTGGEAIFLPALNLVPH
jgi:hypothetical protein